MTILQNEAGYLPEIFTAGNALYLFFIEGMVWGKCMKQDNTYSNVTCSYCMTKNKQVGSLKKMISGESCFT